MNQEFDNSDLRVIGLDKFAARAMNDTSFMRELWEIGGTQFDSMINKMQLAIENNEFQQLQDLAHTLKGSVDIFEMINIASLMVEWIEQTKDNILPTQKQLDKLKEAITFCLIEIDDFIKQKEQ